MTTMNTHTNESLLARLATDPNARTLLVQQNMGLVHQIVNRMVRRSTMQEDAVQQATIALLRAIDTYDATTGNRFSTHAYTCVLNEMRMMLRTDSTYRKYLHQNRLLTTESEVVETHDEPYNLHGLLERARLDDRHRQVIEMRYGINGVERRSLAECATVMGVSIENIRQIEKRAMQMLRAAASTKEAP